MKRLGAVLAGGRSSRFGSDKARTLLAGRALIDHALAALAPHVEALVVCGRDWPGVASLPDRPAPGLGPLGGLAAALHHAGANGFDGVIATGCDMPVLPHGLVDRLVGPDAAIVAGHPLIGWWPASLGQDLDHLLAADGSRAIRAFADRVAARRIDAAPGTLPNINTPADLAALAQRWPA
ncbi:molybdenum cofactor guanylyltransferase [Sphingomonas sp. 1P06PA]|uniref:molybdenum cofactor guanylyltransferase n=1 Tax=Sphingomonas sp. 1P06PA TaxID=554121 RepID=UPI0039A5135F